ncbi:kunitz-type serine protease inhibitor homolog beta-bungarotoxin B3 chain [Drosophila sechellia]|uniref:kunitz-type serine protease inhibitor homolog beta-bungarotoxin B3 chain n=1 Tax=Drosophila sechellia TaxID=7238 RepID=UPI0013DE1951|nr:kunitz-type serine protease inhibitor homolog beta-bungarotoxin B3 chain [Drosophila sechellia]
MEMKFVVITFLISYVIAQSNADCVNKPIVDGNCDQIIKGFTYATEENRCKMFRTKGCTVVGNYFRSREECELKCKGYINWRDIGFESYGIGNWEESVIDDYWVNGSQESEVESISNRGSKKRTPRQNI